MKKLMIEAAKIDRKLNVLVIDDSEIALRAMTDVLTRRGHVVATLPTAIGSTQVILRREIDVVVIDINLPSMQGDRLAALFRSNPRLRKLAVVLVSGIDRGELGRLAEASGADAIVTKSDVPNSLASTVEQAANRRAAGEPKSVG